MANTYYAPGRQRAARVKDLFDAIAPRYDLINDLQSFGLHRLWKQRLVRMAESGSCGRVLDLCCGTGDLALALAGPGRLCAGLDFSRGMLRAARRRLQRAADPAASPHTVAPTSFVRGDALKLPFQEGSFDLVTVGYGLRNLADLDAGLREILRVLRPGGRVLILEFGKPRNPAWRACYFAYLRSGVPLFGRVCCGNRDSYAYILESLDHYPDPGGITRRLRELKFARVRLREFLGGVMGIHQAEKEQGPTLD